MWPLKPAVIAITGHCAIHNAAMSAMPARISFNTPRLNELSKRMKPARSPNHTSRPKLIHAPIDVASASPTCPRLVNARNAILNAMLTPAAASAAFTGVAVSPRARNGDVKLRINTNGISPAV